MAKNNLKTELNASRHRLGSLEVRREILCREQINAASAQRELWLGDAADEKALTRAAQRLATAEATLAGIDDALSVTRDRIAQLTADLAVAEDVEAREAKAAALEGLVPEISNSFADLKAAVTKFVGVLDNSSVPEAAALRNWTMEYFTPMAAEVPRLCTLHNDAARIARNTPTPPVKPPPQPVPQLLPTPGRRADLPDRAFVDWDHAR
jgi:hypothetical protein